MSNIHNDRFYEARQQWLDEMGSGEPRVMEDKKGEFIMKLEETGFVKVYLPDSIQNSHE